MNRVSEVLSIVDSWLAKCAERPNQFACTGPNYVAGEGWEIGVALARDHRGLVSIDAPVESATEGKKLVQKLTRELAKRDWAEMRAVLDLRR